MYKLIFIDIDGTLLNSDHTISMGAFKAIKRITQKNKIPVILTTARPPQAIKKICTQLDLNFPVICFNGALILDNNYLDHFSYLLAYSIGPTFPGIIIKAATNRSLSISFYQMEKWFSDNHNYWIKQEEEITGTKVEIINTDLLLNKWVKENEGPNKIVLMGDPSNINSIETILKQIAGHEVNIYKSKPNYLEIMSRFASKKSAITFLLKKYNLTNKDILAIGDNYNDIEMIQFAEMGIAMGNAPAEVKAYADFVTLDNDSDGMAFALKKFIP